MTCELSRFSPTRLMDIKSCDKLFLVGTTLATYSAFRYLAAGELIERLLMQFM